MRQRIWLFALRATFSNENGWPLRLRPISEAELVQIFIAGPARPHFVARSKNPYHITHGEMAIASPTAARPGVTAEEVATIAVSGALACRPPGQHIDDATWQHFASLLPGISRHGRTHGALLWGERLAEITQQWLALAHMLQQTGHAGSSGAAQPAGRSFWLTGGKLPDANGANRASDIKRCGGASG